VDCCHLCLCPSLVSALRQSHARCIGVPSGLGATPCACLSVMPCVVLCLTLEHECPPRLLRPHSRHRCRAWVFCTSCGVVRGACNMSLSVCVAFATDGCTLNVEGQVALQVAPTPCKDRMHWAAPADAARTLVLQAAYTSAWM
jgi:hypothetical protein